MTDTISLATEIAGIAFPNLMTNAAGVSCETTQELNAVLASEAGGVTTKSATPVARPGNPTPRQELLPLGSINSMGLPNRGLGYYLAYATQRQALAGQDLPAEVAAETAQHKPVILSVSGLSIEDNLAMLKDIQQSPFTGLTELNLSCPNVVGKAQLGYDFEAVVATLTEVFSHFTKPLGLKLPPYFDFFQFDGIAEAVGRFPIAYVNMINSIGNGLAIDAETETVLIKPKGGFGGIGGELVKPTALANVRAMRLRLHPDIKIIGTGGIRTGQDVFEHVLCGADAVQVGTELWREGPGVFKRLSEELRAIMKEKGYGSLDDFRGKLKTMGA
ncbi:dihydroorotate oxidase [Formicincola oecophyllae]|uniref:dihydroorotate oxidase (fumarate) n=1 Tax=Formicincola oecophyllae TaxID=2558361 RepID=A0A4Y6U7A4_9PROT|nr:dihydroorotate oxidase [Formicincola oecophyllae]QDH13192.1 dihydroorotate oxidase [Formicincola oecophyllae]